MRELFARWRDSGLSLMAFGKREGVAYSKLLYWRKKFAGEPTEFIPVEVVSGDVPSDTRASRCVKA